MVCYRIDEYPSGDKPILLGEKDEVWRNDEHVSFSSAPVYADRVCSTIATGELLCVDAKRARLSGLLS